MGTLVKKKKKVPLSTFIHFFFFFYNDDKESRFSWILNFCFCTFLLILANIRLSANANHSFYFFPEQQPAG